MREGARRQRSREYDLALACFDRARDLDPGDWMVHAARAEVLDVLARSDEALASYATALDLDPDSDIVHANRACALAACGRVEEAIDAFERALSIARHPDSLGKLAVLLLVTGDRERSRDLLAEACAADPDALAGDHDGDPLRFVLTGGIGAPEEVAPTLVDEFERLDGLSQLSASVAAAIPAILSSAVPGSRVRQWAEAWRRAGKYHEQFRPAVRLLEAAVAWHDDRDRKHLLALAPEEREILVDLLPTD